MGPHRSPRGSTRGPAWTRWAAVRVRYPIARAHWHSDAGTVPSPPPCRPPFAPTPAACLPACVDRPPPPPHFSRHRALGFDPRTSPAVSPSRNSSAATPTTPWIATTAPVVDAMSAAGRREEDVTARAKVQPLAETPHAAYGLGRRISTVTAVVRGRRRRCWRQVGNDVP
jgi:hypothetical protein